MRAKTLGTVVTAPSLGQMRRSTARAYPLGWRLFDLADNAAERFVPDYVAARIPLVLLLPAVLLVSVLTVGLLMVLEQSFHAVDTTTFLLQKAYTLKNYGVLLSRSQYLEFGGRALLSAVFVAVCCLLFAFPYAYFLVRSTSPVLKKILMCCIFVPFLVGSVVRAFAWIVVLGRTGLINTVLHWLGLPQLDLVYNMTGVLIGLVQLFLPITILILVPAVTSIHEEMDEAAQSLGAHWVRALWTVVLPMARPGLVNAFVIVLTLVFSDFAVPAILGGGRADFITNVIQRTYVDAGDRGVGGALCVAVTAVTLAIIGVFFVARSLSAGKGGTQHA